MSTAFMETAVEREDDFTVKAISGQIGVDKAEGIVEAFVSGIGNKDSVDDIVLSGAFNSSLKRRKPRVVWGHDWNQPIGKVLEIYEVPKTDPRLPEKMKKAKIGGLYAKVQFNLTTDRGREAFANVAFYGNEQEWSIGYKTLTANYDAALQANLLKEVELYEISPVLHGANQLTGTISVKDNHEGSATKMHIEDTDKPSNRDDATSSMIAAGLSQALRKPVKIISVDGNSVIFETGENMTWMATFSMDDDQLMVGKPTRVKPSVSYTPVGDSAPPSMMVKNNDTELPDSLRDADPEPGTWGLPNVALAWSKTFGCSGYHSHGAGYLPCDTHEEYLEALKRFDGNANINAQNNNLAGVEVEESKDATGGCSCGTEEKGHGEYVKREKPEYLSDPMALLLMAYNEMLKLRGAGDLREATLQLISGVEDYLTSAPMSRAGEQGEKSTSGFIVHIKCSDAEALDVSSSLAGVPVFSFKTDNGVDVHFSANVEHDELMVKVADSLAGLDFVPVISVTDPIDTDEGVQ